MVNGESTYFQKIVEINAGAIFYLSGMAKNIKEGSQISNKLINEGKTKSYLNLISGQNN